MISNTDTILLGYEISFNVESGVEIIYAIAKSVYWSRAMHTSTAPKTIKLFAIAGLGEVYQAFAEGHGRIKFHGSFWRAQLHQLESQSSNGQLVDSQLVDSQLDGQLDGQPYLRRLTAGELVLVVGRLGLTLLVQPYDANLPTDVLEPGSAL